MLNHDESHFLCSPLTCENSTHVLGITCILFSSNGKWELEWKIIRMQVELKLMLNNIYIVKRGTYMLILIYMDKLKC